jgi:hypothetical protein
MQTDSLFLVHQRYSRLLIATTEPIPREFFAGDSIPKSLHNLARLFIGEYDFVAVVVDPL